ncbi:hypothetical protein MPSEU_000274700 [Mayamaea pseudoterrestris]|nr:hypothetical protein MPSEU_000274700 [Mayamaea pseudoterrestris]
MLRLLPSILISLCCSAAAAFSVSSISTRSHQLQQHSFQLFASNDGTDKRKRRRRKQSSTTAPPTPDPVKTSLPEMEGIDDPLDEDLTEDDILELAKVAKFEFRPRTSGEAISMPNVDVRDLSKSSEAAAPIGSEGAIPLPDIREVRQKKAMQEEIDRIAVEELETRVRIKRSDTKALRDLIEMQPFADADESYFEEKAYGTVSALLGERTRPFLGIPPGPLQVGHFVGALVIMLMAFVQYPGFPLTNLPTPVRDALQGALGLVFAINTVLAVQATFKASERGQSKVLWAIKTFSVGGLAVDQLSSLPTLAEVERAKLVKGKRALKNKK